MTTERIKEIQAETAYPNSRSVQQALLKVWNEVEQEQKQVKNCSIPFAGLSLPDEDEINSTLKRGVKRYHKTTEFIILPSFRLWKFESVIPHDNIQDVLQRDRLCTIIDNQMFYDSESLKTFMKLGSILPENDNAIKEIIGLMKTCDIKSNML